MTDKSESMVERVAMAICRAVFLQAVGSELRECVDLKSTAFDRALEREWCKCIPEARAAIEAMREPTAKMERAGNDAVVAVFAADEFALTAWQAMIDDALGEQDEDGKAKH